ncbi:MAG: 2-oxo acid dehydrogenase subunit E2, partial [Comamonas sp.]|nr:2-oxo acid dehydrogenase subunit E2 [Comamonas sp.]
MGIYIIRVPDIGEGIAEVEIAAWHVQVGDVVAEDQVIADIMTDKATVEVPCHVHGKVLALGGKVGDVLPVGAELVRLQVEGEGNLKEETAEKAPVASENVAKSSAQPVVTLAAAAPTSAPAPAPATKAAPAARPSAAPHVARKEGERPMAAPSVRQRALD